MKVLDYGVGIVSVDNVILVQVIGQNQISVEIVGFVQDVVIVQGDKDLFNYLIVHLNLGDQRRINSRLINIKDW
jgi:hypothetical protein